MKRELQSPLKYNIGTPPKCLSCTIWNVLYGWLQVPVSHSTFIYSLFFSFLIIISLCWCMVQGSGLGYIRASTELREIAVLWSIYFGGIRQILDNFTGIIYESSYMKSWKEEGTCVWLHGVAFILVKIVMFSWFPCFTATQPAARTGFPQGIDSESNTGLTQKEWCWLLWHRLTTLDNIVCFLCSSRSIRFISSIWVSFSYCFLICRIAHKQQMDFMYNEEHFFKMGYILIGIWYGVG